MKILFITTMPINYNSSANIRNLALIDGLKRNGAEIDILCSYSNINNKFVDKSVKLDDYNILYIGNKIDYSSFDVKSNNGHKVKIINLLKKINSKISIYDNRKVLLRYVSKIKFEKKYDLIISSSDPKSSHLITKKIIKLNPNITKKWIQYWGDPFANDINNRGLLKKIFTKKEEKKIISYADKIVYVSPFTLNMQKIQYHLFEGKMSFLPIPYTKEKIYNKTNNKKKKIGYFGDYYSRNRNIVPLYDAIKNSEYELNICGSSDLNLHSNKNINIMGRQNRDIIDNFESDCDLLICICNLNGTQIPGKIYHYAATNKPILIILDGDESEKMKEYFLSYNRYYMCYNNVGSINETIKMIFKENKDFGPSDSLKSKEIAKRFLNLVK